MAEINLGSGDNLLVKTSQVVSMQERLVLMHNGKSIELNVKIEADFSTIPDQYHEVFLNMVTIKYYNKVSFGDNPFSKCIPTNKKRWYQFWKTLN